MVQIINISEARNTLSSLVKKINKTQTPIIIVQNSKPAVVVYPYKQIQTDRAKEKEFQQEFDTLLASGKRLFARYTTKKGIKRDLSENDAYTVIKNG